jgi:clan AA aspartic protease (TIGR02281 family)
MSASVLVVRADASFDAGLASYKRKDYKKAQAYFAQAISANPSDANAIYYHGLSSQGLGDNKAAIRDYASIMSHFPRSAAGRYAGQALRALEPTYYRQLSKEFTRGGGSAVIGDGGRIDPRIGGRYQGRGGYGGSDTGSLPDSSTVYFQSSGGDNPLILIPTTVNGRPIQMVFDTGAGAVAVGKNHLAEIGVAPPSGPPTGSAHGVGSSAPVPTWDMNAVVKVGDITRTMPILVQETMLSQPLLGQSFFNAFTYEIDNSAHSIRFKRKGTGDHGGNFGTADTVPFTRDPRSPTHLIVTAEVNGRKMPMFFDTGAQPIAFTLDQARSVGISIPDDAQQGISQGIGGQTVGWSFPIRSIRLGPISKTDISINVIKDAMMPYPLLGQAFYGDYKYTIDENNNRIIFRR